MTYTEPVQIQFHYLVFKRYTLEGENVFSPIF